MLTVEHRPEHLKAAVGAQLVIESCIVSAQLYSPKWFSKPIPLVLNKIHFSKLFC